MTKHSIIPQAERPCTPRQMCILATILYLQETRGLPPTLVEISQHLGMNSKCGAQTGVEALVAKQMVTRVPHTSRTLAITELGLIALEKFQEPEDLGKPIRRDWFESILAVKT